MRFYFQDVFRHFPSLMYGLGISIVITVISVAVGMVIGLAAYLGKTGQNKFLRGLCTCYIEFIRNVPLLVQLYIIYFGFSQYGLNISSFFTAIIAMSINTGAYAAEILRSGFKAVNPGTIEAGSALGMTKTQTFLHVMLKPGLRSAFPALINQFVMLFLFSSVASTIALPELFHQVQMVDTKTARTFEVLFVAGILYYVSSFVFIKLFRIIEKKLFRW